jgi:ribosomal protein S14
MLPFYKKGSEFFRDKTRRVSYKRCEGHIFALRCLSDSAFSRNSKKNILPIMPFFSKIRNRCVLSGKAGSVFSRFRVSRIKFRSFVLFGFFPGVLKAS